MIILGIDPGSRKSGFGVIEKQGKKLRYLDSGVIHYDIKLPILERLLDVKRRANEILTEYCPDEISLESLIFVKSPQALIKLAQARGVMIASFLETHQGKIFEYSPNLIKSVATGHGHAQKESVQKFLQLSFGHAIEFQTDDESDALAAAYCHGIYEGRVPQKVRPLKTSSRGLGGALAHKWSDS